MDLLYLIFADSKILLDSLEVPLFASTWATNRTDYDTEKNALSTLKLSNSVLNQSVEVDLFDNNYGRL